MRHVQMMEFGIGERVCFQTDLRRVEGVLVRYNKKSVTVLSDDGERWTVSPGFLNRAEAKRATNLVEMRKADLGKYTD